MYTGPERRVHVRTSKPVQATIQIPSNNVLMDWHSVSIKNISAGGLYFTCDREFSAGSLLNFKIHLSSEARPVRCTGKILRVGKIGGSETFGAAVCFVDIDPADQNLINTFASA